MLCQCHNLSLVIVMGKINLSHAAKMYGMSRRTIQRHMAQGRISSELSDDGQRLFDLSELMRVYGEPKSPTDDDMSNAHDSDSDMSQPVTGENNDPPTYDASVIERMIDELHASHERERASLERETALMRELLEAKQAVIEAQQKLLPSPDKAVSKKWWQFWR